VTGGRLFRQPRIFGLNLFSGLLESVNAASSGLGKGLFKQTTQTLNQINNETQK
jgi:hypothetical protein